jgi:hypothetical protein
MPSVGLVVTPERFYQKVVSLVRFLVQHWVILGCYKCTFVVTVRSILFHLFYRVYFASEKHATRTSKTPYMGSFLRGHISIKNWTYCPVLRESATPFKRTCLLIRLKEVPDALYGPHLQR